MSSEAPPLLRMVGISKNFGGSDVLSDVNFDLLGGEVHALMGENGAGKSTLMRILAGVHWAHRGQIYLDGKEESIDSPRAAKALGIAIIHQELSVVPDMSVAENLALGQEPRKWAGSLDRRRVVEDARVKLATVNASFNPNTAMRDLSVGQQQLVEIARASSSNARILILDEPTAALSAAEAQTLFALIRQMREQGMGLILISHRLDEVWSLSDRLTVLRDGRLVSVTERATITPGDVVRQMVGRDIEDLFGRGERDAGQAVLEVEDLTNGSDIGPVSLQVRAGEVVGMFGLIGAGRTELVRLIFGADPSRGGVIRVSGKVTRPRTPHIAIKDRIGLLPESRKEQGLFLEMSIRDNVAISSLKRFSRFGSLLQRPLAESVSRRMKQLRISVQSDKQPVGTLSGGNQQKVLLARWLEVGSRVLILDEPTRGVDVGARSDIYRIINQLAEEGTALLLVSSDLAEIIGISDRVLVVRNGRVAAEVPRVSATEELIMLHATGLYRESEASEPVQNATYTSEEATE